ncbi:MAG: hypothetical protein IJU02_08770, partial [Lachnospiraceae bacterium]|nr:hypothetical protein [Lachnospiraceae bacterium]
MADINSQRLRDLIQAVFGAKGDAILGGDGEHLSPGNVAGKGGKLRIRTDRYLNTITHITIHHYSVDPRTGTRTYTGATYETRETGYVYQGSTYTERDIPASSNQEEMNKILDSRQAQMELMGQASRGISNGLLDLLKAEVARGRYRQLINKLKEELAKAGLSKEQIEALMNCKNYQDALKFYSLLAEFRTREDGREGLSILDTKEEFINTLKDCWDSLTEMFERLDAPTEFFTREHIVPILVNVLPWGKGL